MPPVEMMRRHGATIRAGDRQAADAMFAGDVVGHEPGRSQLAGERRGFEGTAVALGCGPDGARPFAYAPELADTGAR